MFKTYYEMHVRIYFSPLINSNDSLHSRILSNESPKALFRVEPKLNKMYLLIICGQRMTDQPVYPYSLTKALSLQSDESLRFPLPEPLYIAKCKKEQQVTLNKPRDYSKTPFLSISPFSDAFYRCLKVYTYIYETHPSVTSNNLW